MKYISLKKFFLWTRSCAVVFVAWSCDNSEVSMQKTLEKVSANRHTLQTVCNPNDPARSGINLYYEGDFRQSVEIFVRYFATLTNERDISVEIYDLIRDHNDNYPKLAVDLNTLVHRAKNEPKQLAQDLYVLFDN